MIEKERSYPNLSKEVVGKLWKIKSPEGGRKGRRVEKKCAHRTPAGVRAWNLGGGGEGLKPSFWSPDFQYTEGLKSVMIIQFLSISLLYPYYDNYMHYRHVAAITVSVTCIHVINYFSQIEIKKESKNGCF